MYNAPVLKAANAERIIEVIKSIRAEGGDVSEVIDHRPDGKGEVIHAFFYSVYDFTNAAGDSSRVVAHFDNSVEYPAILKLDAQDRLAIDIDVAREVFDWRGTNPKSELKHSKHFFDNDDLHFENVHYISIGDKIVNKETVGNSGISVEIPV